MACLLARAQTPLTRLAFWVTTFFLGTKARRTAGANGIIDDLEIRRDVLNAGEIADRATGRFSIGYDRNYFPSLMIDEQALGLTHLPALPNWDLEIPVREAL